MDLHVCGRRAKLELEECILDAIAIKSLNNAGISSALGLQCGRIKDNAISHPDYISYSIMKNNPKFIKAGKKYTPAIIRTVGDMNEIYARAQEHLLELLDLTLYCLFKEVICRNCDIENMLDLQSDNSWLANSLLSILMNQGIVRQLGEKGPYVLILYQFAAPQQIVMRGKSGYSAKQIMWLNSIGSNIQHAKNDGEYTIIGTNYRADGYCKENNTIYEFHGCYWHGCPRCFTPVSINARSGHTFADLYMKTQIREEKIKSLGYNLVVMWECDFN